MTLSRRLLARWLRRIAARLDPPPPPPPLAPVVEAQAAARLTEQQAVALGIAVARAVGLVRDIARDTSNPPRRRARKDAV